MNELKFSQYFCNVFEVANSVKRSPSEYFKLGFNRAHIVQMLGGLYFEK